MSFSDENVENVFEFTQRLAFPRLVGTEGEKIAQEMIAEELKTIGNPQREELISCSMFVINIVFRYVLPIGAFLLFFAWLFSDPLLSLVSPISSFIIALLACLWFILASSFIDRSFGYVPKFGRKYRTKNFISEISPTSSQTTAATLIYVAHYDSKSQLYPGLLRIFLFISGIIAGLVYCIQVMGWALIELTGGIPNGFWAPSIISFLIPLCFNGLLAFNSVGNKSPGALDNATSVATVIELSRILKDNRFPHLRLIFLISAAEEVGLYGAAAYVKAHKEELDPATTFFLNYDGIGSKNKTILLTAYGIPPKKTSQILNKLIEEIVVEKGYSNSFRKIYLPIGGATDHVPIQRAGFEVAMLGSFISRFHTSKDTMDAVDKKSLKVAGDIGYELARKLEQKFGGE
ncbi:MAG: M28 family metallopeptidase [Candidatus Helarchaeota archaeon]